LQETEKISVFLSAAVDRGKTMYQAFVEAKHIRKTYRMGEVKIHAVEDVNFAVNQGEFTVIVGPSGAGKTTVLNILGGMDQASGGEVWIDGRNIAEYRKKELIRYRREEIGFVFQFYNLVQNLTALENVELAVQICKDYSDPEKVLEEVGLGERKNNFPAQLSGGEQQRVAIARALAKNPKLLLCDEPTGALDYRTGKSILKLLWNASKVSGHTVFVITHNQALCPMADRVIEIRNGTVERVTVNEHPTPIEEIEW
jgi:putative ABC transport system ATP-binding protein